MRRQLTLLVLPLGLLLAACDAAGPSQLSGGDGNDGAGTGDGVTSTGSGNHSTGASMSGTGGGEPAPTALDDRSTDYMEAYRTASVANTMCVWAESLGWRASNPRTAGGTGAVVSPGGA